jgi:hypothetical protein
MTVLRTVGRSGQVSLGKKYEGRHVLIDEIEDGVWVIKLGEFVPDSERWLHEPKTAAVLDQAITWAEGNPAADSELDDFAARIEDE